jgi:iron complex outermembrane receptor protein
MSRYVTPRSAATRRSAIGLVTVAATLIGSALSSHAFAADPPQDPAAAPSSTAAPSTAALEEVVVTAEKRSERLLDVPMSVTAISGAQLTSAGVTSTLDLGEVTPGLLVSNIGTGFIPSIRGVSSSGTSPGDESNVALYIDDVYLGDTLAGWFDLPDIERIEVLKGPQGTLFGRNATGGAIRIVTRSPSSDPVFDASADYGFNFREVRLTGYASGPITDQIAASFSAYRRTGDGYVKGIADNLGKTFGGPDDYVYRGKLLFNVSDTLKLTIESDTSQTDNQAGALPTALGENPYPGAGSVGNAPFQYAGGTYPIQLVKSYGSTIDLTWTAADWVSMRSISAYRYFDLTYQVDIDRTSEPISGLALEATQRNISQEFNFFGPAEQAFTWLVGAFYYNSDASNPYFTSYTGDAPDGPVVANFFNSVETRSYAGFGDVTWNATSQLHVTAGARYTTETKNYVYGDTVRPGGVANRYVTDSATWDSPTFRGVVRYDFAPDANVYASLSNGFKSGVFNSFSPLPIPVKPEKIEALEVGVKARVDGVTLTAAGYGYNYTDIQVQAQTLVNGIPLLTLNNAASAKLRGLEFTADGKLSEHIAAYFGVNYEPHAQYSSYATASVTLPNGTAGPVVGFTVVPYNASGSRIIKAPEWTPDLRLTYTTGFMGGSVVGTINDAYTSSFYWQPANLTKEAGYNLINMRASWTDPKDRWTFSLWGTNVTNVVYSTYTSANTRGNTETYAQPRQIGVGASLRF